jgi:hypothetical protein
MGELRNACKVLVKNAKGKRPLARITHRWKDDIKIYLQNIGGCGLHSSGSG